MNKAPDAFRTISEVADDLELPQHVLRFWETKFSQIKPLKRGGGRRYYRPDDIDLLRGIKQLLYEEGYTIRGLQRIFKEQGIRFVIDLGRGEIPESAVLRAETGSNNAQSPGNDKGGAKSSGGKSAVSVSQFAESNRKAAMDRKGGRTEAGSSGGTQPLSKEDRRSLQATLYELLECKRLLDQVRGS